MNKSGNLFVPKSNEERLKKIFAQDDDDEGEAAGSSQIKSFKKNSNRAAQPKLNESEICGPKGIPDLLETFKDYQFDPRRDMYGNLNDVMDRIKNWAHRLHPKMNFVDFINRVESLSSKRDIKVALRKMRYEDVENRENADFNPAAGEGTDDEDFNQLSTYEMPKSQTTGVAATSDEISAESRFDRIFNATNGDESERRLGESFESTRKLFHDNIEIDEDDALNYIFSTE